MTKTKRKDAKNNPKQLDDGPKSPREPRRNVVATPSATESYEKIAQKYEEIKSNVSPATQAKFDAWNSTEFAPDDYEIPIEVESLEASIGYSSLIRQMANSYVRSVAFYRSKAGGALTIEEARRRAFRPAMDPAEAVKELNLMLQLPVEQLNFIDLMELYSQAPRVAELFWEEVKHEGRKEFESGHLAANITFPVGYMKQVWNIARYLGVRESFIAEWRPQGGIEIGLIDMLAQSYFQWQYWLEQTVKRSETQEKEEHPAYREWKRYRTEVKQSGEYDGYWLRPYVSEVQAIEHAVQMADRFHRIFMRTLRQLRDLRRYAPVTITNASQVNIAADGGNQLNVSEK